MMVGAPWIWPLVIVDASFGYGPWFSGFIGSGPWFLLGGWMHPWSLCPCGIWPPVDAWMVDALWIWPLESLPLWDVAPGGCLDGGCTLDLAPGASALVGSGPWWMLNGALQHHHFIARLSGRCVVVNVPPSICCHPPFCPSSGMDRFVVRGSTSLAMKRAGTEVARQVESMPRPGKQRRNDHVWNRWSTEERKGYGPSSPSHFPMCFVRTGFWRN